MPLPLKKRNLVTPPTTSRKDTPVAMTSAVASPGENAQQVRVAFAHQAYKQTISGARKALLRAVSDTSPKDRALAMQLDAAFATFINDIGVAKRRKDHTAKVFTIARHPGAPTTPGAQRLVSEFFSYQNSLKSAKKDLKSALDAAGTSADVREDAKKDLKSALVAAGTSTDAKEDPQSQSSEDELTSALHFLDTILEERKSPDASIRTADSDPTCNANVPKRTNLVGTTTSPPGVPQLNSFITTVVSVPGEVQPYNIDVLCVGSHDYDAHYGNQHLAQLIANESTSLHDTSSKEVGKLSGNVTNVAYRIISKVKNQGGRFLQKNGNGTWSIASDPGIMNILSQSILCSIIHAEDFKIDALTKQNTILKEAGQESIKKLHANLEEITTLKQKLNTEEVLSRKRAKRQSELEEHIATLEQQLNANKALVREQAKHVSEQKTLIATLEMELNQERSINTCRDHANFESGQKGRIQFLEHEVDFYRNAYSWEYCCNEQSRREQDERAYMYRYWQSVGAPPQGAAGALSLGLDRKSNRSGEVELIQRRDFQK